MSTRKEVYDAIESERDYQEKTWPKSKNLPAAGEILLLEEYLGKFRTNYQLNDDSDPYTCPEICLHDLRKMAAIVVRAMENTHALKRGESL